VVVKSLQYEANTVLNYERNLLIRFICSIVKILDIRLNKAEDDRTQRILFQANENPNVSGENELASHVALFFILTNIFKSREFDVVQTVRLLQNNYHLFFSTFVSRQYFVFFRSSLVI